MVVENLPACVEHLDPLGVLFGDMAVVVALVEQPQQFEMHRVEQAVGNRLERAGRAVENDLAGFETRQVHLRDLANDV